METKKISCDSLYARIPPLSSKHPWFVAQNLEDEDKSGEQIFYTIHKPLYHYKCQIPELHGRQIYGFYHGWVILCSRPHKDRWSLWNPITSKLIRLPPLIQKQGNTDDFCLSSPPYDPSSVFLLAEVEKPNIIFCRLDRKRKKFKWIKMSYAKQLRSILDEDGNFLQCLTCYNGKVYALHTWKQWDSYVIQVDIVVKEKEVVISLLRFVEVRNSSCIRRFSFNRLPFVDGYSCIIRDFFLKGTCEELFYIDVYFEDETRKTVIEVNLSKLDVLSMTWETMKDLKDGIFFIELADDSSIYYNRAIASEFGGYIHILDEMGKIMYSYHVKDRTISLSSMPPIVRTSQVSSWAMLECRLEDDHAESKQEEENKDKKIALKSVTDDESEFNSTRNESKLLSIPFHLLEMMMEFCVGVEYLKFRATCKHCHLASPLIQWSDKSALSRLQTYSLVSPWLMVLNEQQSIITFTDPLFSDKYFITTHRELIDGSAIHYCKYGWLLISMPGGDDLFFYNPFTSDIRELPEVPYGYFLQSCCFSAPPTSPDCMVAGFIILSTGWIVYIHFIAQEPYGRLIDLEFSGDIPYSIYFPTPYGKKLYGLCYEGELYVFTDIGENKYTWDLVAETPKSCCGSMARYFLVIRDQHLLLVIVGEVGESVEVFSLNDSTKKWEKIDCLGKYTIYIGETTCHCIEAKTKDMENKIFFPRSHFDNGSMMFYSLETCTYHTFNDKSTEENLTDFVGTTQHCYLHEWIEPSWC